MRPDELDAWLGDFADDLSDDQKEHLARVAEALAARYPDEREGQAAMVGATQVAFGDTTLGEAADVWRAARAAEREAMAALTGAVMMSADTKTEAEIVAETRINRMTIRKAMGK